jgi:hypothetical protein
MDGPGPIIILIIKLLIHLVLSGVPGRTSAGLLPATA